MEFQEEICMGPNPKCFLFVNVGRTLYPLEICLQSFLIVWLEASNCLVLDLNIVTKLLKLDVNMFIQGIE